MNWVIDIENAHGFELLEILPKAVGATGLYVDPQTLDTLVVSGCTLEERTAAGTYILSMESINQRR